MKTKNLISVVGPTAIGKTALAIAVARHFKTVVLSADSRQFYREMAIGTAVPSPEELQEAPHYFIQHKSILDTYSVGDFEREALAQLGHTFTVHDTAVLVGGSGLYVDALIQGLDHFPEVDPEIREKLNARLEQEGITTLQQELHRLDGEYYQQVDLYNPRRLIRALEICIGTGSPYSLFLNKEKQARDFRTITIGITAEREVIYDRINQRVDGMLAAGLLEEVSSLQPYQALNALQTVGYRELFRYLAGELSLEVAIAEIKKNTRRFAKRQLTWLQKNKDIIWVPYNYNSQELMARLEQEIATP